jgi:MFS family permease
MRAIHREADPDAMSPASDRLFTSAFIALTLSELAYFTAAGLIIGVTPFFVTGPLGSDEAGLGLVAGAFGVTTLLLRPYAGRMADRRGRRPLLIGGALLCAVVVLAHIPASDMASVVALRLLLGVAEAFYFVAGYAALADLAPPGRTGEALSYNSLALYLGIALGPFVGQVLLDAGGFGAAWAGGFGLALAAGLLALRVPETANRAAPSEARAPAPLIHRAAVGPGLALFTGVAAMSGFLLLVGPHAQRMGIDSWSVTFLVFGGVVVGLRIAFARLPDRVPPMRLGAAALALCAAGLAIASWAPGMVGLLGGTVALASGVAFMTPALFAATFARVTPSERGSAAGTGTLFIDLGFSGGPFVIGFVAASAGIPVAFTVAGLIALAGAIGTSIGPRLVRASVPG